MHLLMLQGGPMSPQEVAEFERNPNLDDILQVHFFDEAGKEPGM